MDHDCPIWKILATCGILNLNHLKLIQFKIQFHSHTSHISTAKQPHVAVAIILDRADTEHFYFHRKIY